MINPIPTWGEGGLVLVRLTDSSVVAVMNQMSKYCDRSTPIQAKSNIEQELMKIFLKPDRDQTEVFSTSNFYGYVIEYRGSLSDQNFIDLIQTVSVSCNLYILTCPYCNDLF